MIPSADQIAAQLRILIPLLGTLVTTLGAPAASVGSWTQILLVSVGPISYVVTVIWSFVANSRKSIMLSASKPVGPGAIPPQIVLPREEAALALSLPSNVHSTETAKVVAR